MKKTKLIFMLLLLPALLLLTGCLQLDIGIGIDEDYTSFLSYSIKMDVSRTDPQYHEILADALNNFGWLYQENYGFTVGVGLESGIYSLTMNKRINNNSLPEAFASLESMITDENITAFMMVDMHIETLPRAESYFVRAMIDIPKIISLSSAVELPPDVQELFEESVPASGGVIDLTLPASQLGTHSHETEMFYRLVKMSVPFDFTSQTELELCGSVVYSEDGTQAGTFDEMINRNMRAMEIVLIAGGSVFVLLLIILLAILLRIRAHNKLYD